MLQGVYKSQTTKIAHHYQSGSGGVKYINSGTISNDGSTIGSGSEYGWFIKYNKGDSLKLVINRSWLGSGTNFRDEDFPDYVPLVIIPHFKMQLSEKYVIDISTLANMNFTCQYPVILENKTITAKNVVNDTFTINALVIKIHKIYMLPHIVNNILYYELPVFDIIFDDFKPKIIAGLIDYKFDMNCIVCEVDISTSAQGYYRLHNISPTFISGISNMDLTDFKHYNYYDDFLRSVVKSGFLADGYSIVLFTSPRFWFYRNLHPTPTGEISGFDFLIKVDGTSDNGVRAAFHTLAGEFAYYRYLIWDNFNIDIFTHGYHYIPIITIEGYEGSANTNKWEWVRGNVT